MPKYTVIGLYESTGETFCNVVEAEDQWKAIGISAREACRAHNGDDLEILGVIEGEVILNAVCEDSGKAAFACDLAYLAEDEPAEEGDDLCDQCHRSGVNVSEVDLEGKTICADCAASNIGRKETDETTTQDT